LIGTHNAHLCPGHGAAQTVQGGGLTLPSPSETNVPVSGQLLAAASRGSQGLTAASHPSAPPVDLAEWDAASGLDLVEMTDEDVRDMAASVRQYRNSPRSKSRWRLAPAKRLAIVGRHLWITATCQQSHPHMRRSRAPAVDYVRDRDRPLWTVHSGRCVNHSVNQRVPSAATDATHDIPKSKVSGPEQVSPVRYRSTDQEVAGSNLPGAIYGQVIPRLITRSAGRVELIFCR
jgi:hypothetical protein